MKEIPLNLLFRSEDRSMNQSYERAVQIFEDAEISVGQMHPLWDKSFRKLGYAVFSELHPVDRQGKVLPRATNRPPKRKKRLGDTAFSYLRALYQADKGYYRTFVIFVAREIEPNPLKEDALLWEAKQKRQVCRIPWERKTVMKRKPRQGLRAWILAYDFVVPNVNGTPRQQVPGLQPIEEMLKNANFPKAAYSSP